MPFSVRHTLCNSMLMLFTTAPKTAEEEMRWKQTIKCSLVLPGEASGWSWHRLGFFNFSIFLLASLFFSPESEREAFYRRLSLMTTFQPIATAFRTNYCHCECWFGVMHPWFQSTPCKLWSCTCFSAKYKNILNINSFCKSQQWHSALHKNHNSKWSKKRRKIARCGCIKIDNRWEE